jgi:hypothetical protein
MGAPPRTHAEAIHAQAAALGDVLTIEDLARGVLALEEGALPGVAPLEGNVRDEVGRRLAAANERREALLAIEADLAVEDARLAAAARAMAETLTPEQREWVMEKRDQVSVAGVERAYWDAVLNALGAPPAHTTTP